MSQIGMGFDSPKIESHTFKKFLGAWNSNSYHEGTIKTADGRTLDVKTRLSYPDQGMEAIINGTEHLFSAPNGRWHFDGDAVAEVLSDIAIGLTPQLFTKLKEEARIRYMTRSKQRKKETREDRRELNRSIKEKTLLSNTHHPTE